MASALHQLGRSEESIRRNPDAVLCGSFPFFRTDWTAWATEVFFTLAGTSMATLVRYFLYETSASQISRGFCGGRPRRIVVAVDFPLGVRRGTRDD